MNCDQLVEFERLDVGEDERNALTTKGSSVIDQWQEGIFIFLLFICVCICMCVRVCVCRKSYYDKTYFRDYCILIGINVGNKKIMNGIGSYIFVNSYILFI